MFKLEEADRALKELYLSIVKEQLDKTICSKCFAHTNNLRESKNGNKVCYECYKKEK